MLTKRSARKGQAWVLDYSIGLLIFLTVFLFGIKLLTTGFANDPYPAMAKQAETISENLVSEGYPSHWTYMDEASIIRIGLQTDGKLSRNKMRKISQFNYDNLKNNLGSEQNFIMYITNASDSVTAIDDRCYLGPVAAEISQVKSSVFSKTLPSAYMSNGTTDPLKADMVTNLQTGIYVFDPDQEDNLSTLLNNVTAFNTLVFNEPHFQAWGELTKEQILYALETYVKQGGYLIISGNVSETFFGVVQNRTGELTHNIIGTGDDGEYAKLGAGVVSNNGGYDYGINNIDAENFVALSNYTDYTGIARWSIGDGLIYYFPDFQATLNGNPLSDSIMPMLLNMTIRPSVNCSNVGVNASQTEQVINIERFIVYQGEPTLLHIQTWKS